MKEASFVIADVFTDRRFGGNQLAVFTDARALDDGAMQDIAREMNYSETTFILPPRSGGDFQLRIFTPGRELPFAGHPVVGSAFVCKWKGLKSGGGGQSSHSGMQRLVLETGVGNIEIDVGKPRGKSGHAVMRQPLPVSKGVFSIAGEVARALSIGEGDIKTGLPIQALHNGITVMIVPVGSLEAVQRIKPDMGKLEALARQHALETVLAFTTETLSAESSAHCRVFAPGAGVAEDAATGSANGPLGYYLVKNGLVPVSACVHIVSEQGYEMHRPSTIEIDVEVDLQSGEPSSVRVGGGVVVAGEGKILLG